MQYNKFIKIAKVGHKVRVWMLWESLRSPTSQKPELTVAGFSANRKILVFSVLVQRATRSGTLNARMLGVWLIAPWYWTWWSSPMHGTGFHYGLIRSIRRRTWRGGIQGFRMACSPTLGYACLLMCNASLIRESQTLNLIRTSRRVMHTVAIWQY